MTRIAAEERPRMRLGLRIIYGVLIALVVAFASGVLVGTCSIARADTVILATDVVPTLVEDLRYATPDNFLGRAVYADARCRLRPTVARKLAVAARLLSERRAGWRLKVWDCFRSIGVQWEMWAIIPDPRYVADPRRRSRHSVGAAVDLTIVDERGREVEMPTGFDDFSRKAWTNAPTIPAATANRALLHEVMREAGFKPIRTEWWHFEG